MRGKILSLQQSDIVKRANLALNWAIKYHLEYPNGGTDPEAPDCSALLDKQKVADCVGFAAWCAGFDRLNPKFPLYDGYINTDSMIEEATTRGNWFNVHDDPAEGDFIVAASYRPKLTPWRRIIGHIGVITQVAGDHLDVVHCSPSNYTYTTGRSAIEKTTDAIWRNYPKRYYITLNPEMRPHV